MKFINTSISNFLTLGNVSVDLDDRGLLLIQGKNNDDDSAESNGAGKSSVVDALCWALYGTTARGISGDAVINKMAKKNCMVAVSIKDKPEDDFCYSITRFRKHSVGKNQLQVIKIPEFGSPIDLSKGTDRETQEVVNQLIGCSHEVFTAAVYAGQEQMPDLPGMTDKMLKTLIEEAAGVEVLTAAYAVARERMNSLSSTVERNRMAIKMGESLNDRVKADIADLETQKALFEKGRRDRTKEELAKILPINKEIVTLNDFVMTKDIMSIRAEVEMLAAKMDSRKSEEEKLAVMAKKVVDLTLAANKYKMEATALKAQSDRVKVEIADINSLIGKPCGECGKTYCEHDLEAAKTARMTEHKRLRLEMEAKAKEYVEANKMVENAQREAEAFKASMTDHTEMAKRYADLTMLSARIDRALADVKAHESRINEIKADANTKLTEPNPWSPRIEVKKAELEKNEEDVATLIAANVDLDEQYEVACDAVKVFGPAGVRAHILDTVTPYLNDRTQEYLGALADGNIHAVWTTLTTTAKGESKEKFNIEVTNDKGAESFAGLSGGEKRKVRLATAMALQDMVASRAAKPIDLFIADEVDHALDESGLERLMGVLERKARERGTVLVISHNSLADWCSNIITVEKNGGVATVSGAIER